jgi:hypothetical protein
MAQTLRSRSASMPRPRIPTAVPEPERIYRNVTLGFSVVIMGFGAVILAVTLAAGGGAVSTGVLLGVLFMAVGAGRLFIAVRTRR